METIANEVFNDAGSEEIAIEDLDLIIKRSFSEHGKRTGILTPLIEDKDISEIMVNGPENIFTRKKARYSDMIWRLIHMKNWKTSSVIWQRESIVSSMN